MQSSSPHTTEKYKGQDSSISPTTLESGVFSLCSGGFPYKGGFKRVPGKTIRDTGLTTGGIITINQFGNSIVVQTFIGLLIFNISDLIPPSTNFITDNEGNLITTSDGLPILI